MNITISWWIIPLLFTFLSFVRANWVDRHYGSSGKGYARGFEILDTVPWVIAGVLSLFVWMCYFALGWWLS